MNQMLLPLRRYADFKGRSPRREFWLFWLFILLAMCVTLTLDSLLGLGGTTTSYGDVSGTSIYGGVYTSAGWLTWLFCVAVLVPSLAVAARRLHDVNKSGWWILIGLIPFFGNLFLLYHYVQPGTAGPNAYGPDPLATQSTRII